MRRRHWPRDEVTERKHDSDREGNEAPMHGFVAAEFHRTWVAGGGKWIEVPVRTAAGKPPWEEAIMRRQ